MGDDGKREGGAEETVRDEETARAEDAVQDEETGGAEPRSEGSGAAPAREPRDGAAGGTGGDGDSGGDDRSPPPGVKLAELDEVEVTVEKLVAGGDGLARYEGIPLFVPRSAPGDRLRVRITDRRPDYGRAEVVEVLEPGPGRRQPPCPYFERCGGCDLQHLDDDVQVRLKAEAVLETLRRLGAVAPPEDLAVVAGDAWGYRLRAQLHTRRTGDGVEVGYYERGSHDLVPVSACPILVPELEALLPGLPRHLEEGGRVPRRLDMAAGGEAGAGPGRSSGTGAPERRKNRRGEPGEAAEVTTAPLVEGLPHGEVTLELVGLEGFAGDAGSFTYAYDARCFFQAHRGLVGRLVAAAVGPWEGEEAYDLYAGVGLFALPLARRYRRVVAVEGDAGAARYARLNARRNRAGELEVEHLSLDSWIPRLPEGAHRVVADPPRGGLSKKVRALLRSRRPLRFTYVSCHPATLARDLRQLVTQGPYRLESLTLVDLFPQSGHMEVVAQLALEETVGETEEEDAAKGAG